MAVSNIEIRSAVDLRINPKRKLVDSAMKYVFIAAAATTFAVTIAIVATLVVDAIEFLQGLAGTEEGLSALFTIGWFPRRGMFDIGTLVVGTFIVTGIVPPRVPQLTIGAITPAPHPSALRRTRMLRTHRQDRDMYRRTRFDHLALARATRNEQHTRDQNHPATFQGRTASIASCKYPEPSPSVSGDNLPAQTSKPAIRSM